MVREKYLENEVFSMSGKSQGSLWMAREIKKGFGSKGKVREFKKKKNYGSSLQKIYLFCSRGESMYILMR